MTLPHHAPPRPDALLADFHRRNGRDGALWVFGYASLIWRPEFRAAEQRPALVHGWHRALRMRSQINRGTPERPGLVFALLPGGACRGEVYRLAPADVATELQRLWQREMPTGVYTPRWLACRTAQGPVPALAFTLSRRSEAYLGRLPDPQVLDILRHARGRYGTTLDYLVETAEALRQRRIHDREIERLMALAAGAGLIARAARAAPASLADHDGAAQAARPATPTTAGGGTGSAVPSTPGSSSSTPKAG